MSRKRKVKGDCYEAALNLLLEWSFDETLERYAEEGKRAFVVHGTVFHPEPGWHGHAWVEVEGMMEFPTPLGEPPMRVPMVTVYDKSNGHDAAMPRELYYHFGCVREELRRYTVERARELALKTRVYGPWEEEKPDGGVAEGVAGGADDEVPQRRAGRAVQHRNRSRDGARHRA